MSKSEEWNPSRILEFDDFVQELYLFLAAEAEKAAAEQSTLEDGWEDLVETEKSPINNALCIVLQNQINEARCKTDTLTGAQQATEQFIANLTRVKKDQEFRRVKVVMKNYYEEIEAYIEELLTEADSGVLNDLSCAVDDLEEKLASLGYPIVFGIEAYLSYLKTQP